MDKFKNNFNNLQPQLISIVMITIVLVILAIIIYFKVKKVKKDEAPKGIAFIAEQYVKGVDNLFQSVTNNKLSPVAPYIFVLLSFMVLGNLLGLIGFEPPTTSYSVPLILGLVAWFGIYIVGLIYHKLRFFKKFANPVEVIGQFSPLISISFRIFGNMIGGSTIIYLLYHVTGIIWGYIPILGEVNLLGSIIAPPFHIYFDVFDGIIQGFVFTLLTLMYWVLETSDEEVIQSEVAKDKKYEYKITIYESSN